MNSHRLRRTLCSALLLGTAIATSGCVSFSDEPWDFDSIGPITPVPPNPTPTPTPTPTSASVGAVAMPTLGDNPPPPFTPADEARIEDSVVDETATLRMVQAPRSFTLATDPKSTVNDPATASGGARLVLSIPADPDAVISARFTLGNPAMGVDNVLLSEDPSGQFLTATLADGRVLTIALAALDQSSGGAGEDFLWTTYGSWGIRSAANVPMAGSAVVLGTETPDASIPTTGSATFNGFVEGSVAVADGSNLRVANLKGDASITADFASGTLSGAAPTITAIPLGNLPLGSPITPGPAQAWNGLVFNGTFATGLNGFTGTTGVSSAPGNSYSMLSTAAGFFAGRFYGPGAEELGAVWNLYDGTAVATGVLVGGR